MMYVPMDSASTKNSVKVKTKVRNGPLLLITLRSKDCSLFAYLFRVVIVSCRPVLITSVNVARSKASPRSTMVCFNRLVFIRIHVG
ncbi:hypothetical protein E2C01_025448 [Portunus trituberculatus]|uniref:Uncharacterized protein n=1 Tax=Portunus trituberculatus TaxID=210409 RepID=A0A5B7EGG8_PORTR|nr:hypothetical protein [Portunus trituberculatus]